MKNIIFIYYGFKDARSVSFYPYNRSQILQYVEYTKYISTVKGIAIVCDK